MSKRAGVSAAVSVIVAMTLTACGAAKQAVDDDTSSSKGSPTTSSTRQSTPSAKASAAERRFDTEAGLIDGLPNPCSLIKANVLSRLVEDVAITDAVDQGDRRVCYYSPTGRSNDRGLVTVSVIEDGPGTATSANDQTTMSISDVWKNVERQAGSDGSALCEQTKAVDATASLGCLVINLDPASLDSTVISDAWWTLRMSQTGDGSASVAMVTNKTALSPSLIVDVTIDKGTKRQLADIGRIVSNSVRQQVGA